MTDIMDKAREYLAEHEDGCGSVVEAEVTDEQLADIRKWLEQASEPCGNDACIGEWAAVHGRALLAEVERLRAENEVLLEDIDALHRECARLYEIEDEHRKCPL